MLRLLAHLHQRRSPSGPAAANTRPTDGTPKATADAATATAAAARGTKLQDCIDLEGGGGGGRG